MEMATWPWGEKGTACLAIDMFKLKHPGKNRLPFPDFFLLVSKAAWSLQKINNKRPTAWPNALAIFLGS